ncbi:hypothetical protein COW06_03845 [Candidatus Gracilibacteria bacterium CG12_big_fil_rev_8_21_14_0_65_38_15]|nr:MAG: hypothetical protein COW06_03845 [Candidatus Gracilibacteria bacterium CG12_big_fil_rev_8_21_14_0_65_38_15]
MLRTVVYIRKSSETEDKQAQSIERQERDIKEFLERYNSTVDFSERLDIKDTFREQQSAKKPGRVVFNKMMESIKKRKYDVLLCTEASRLSRNPLDTGMLIHVMDEEYIRCIRTISNSYASNSSTEKFTLGLFLSISKYENDQRAQNTKSGMANRKAQGATTNIANMGYRNIGEHKGNRSVEPDGENFDIFQNTWKKLQTGRYKVSELYDEAVKQGFTRIAGYKRGERREVPSQGAFREALRNPYYMGILKEGAPGSHKPMVSKEEFETAQVILQKTGWKHSKEIENVSYENLLKEVLICGKTGNPFYVNVKTRYYCPTKNCSGRYYSAGGPKACPTCGKVYKLEEYKNIHIRKTFDVRGTTHTVYDKETGKTTDKGSFEASLIEHLIDEHISKIQISEGLFQVFKKQLYTLWMEQVDITKKKVSTKRKDIEKQEEKRRKLNESLFSENMNDQQKVDLEGSISDITQDIHTIEDEINELREEDEEGFEKAWQALNVLLQAKTVFAPGYDIGFEPKRRLVLSMFSNLKFIDGEIIPEWQEPFATIANANLTKQKSQELPEISGLN